MRVLVLAGQHQRPGRSCPRSATGCADWRLGRVVTVVDRGFSSRENLAYLQRAGGHYIAGERMRDGNAHAARGALPPGPLPGRPRQPARQGSPSSTPPPVSGGSSATTPTRPNATPPRARPRSPDRRRARPDHHRPHPGPRAGHSPRDLDDERGHEAPRRADRRAGGDRARQGRMRAARAPRPRALATPDHLRAAGPRPGEDRRGGQAGKYLLSTSDPDLTAEDVALGYKNLLDAERGFRDLKSTIVLRPVFHRIEPRIRAHVLLCWLALLLIRVAERRTGQTWRQINRELGRLHAITLTGPAGTVVQTTEPTDRPVGHSSGLRPRPATPDHHPRPHLSSETPWPGFRPGVDTRAHPHPAPVLAGQPPNSALTSAHELRNPGLGITWLSKSQASTMAAVMSHRRWRPLASPGSPSAGSGSALPRATPVDGRSTGSKHGSRLGTDVRPKPTSTALNSYRSHRLTRQTPDFAGQRSFRSSFTPKRSLVRSQYRPPPRDAPDLQSQGHLALLAGNRLDDHDSAFEIELALRLSKAIQAREAVSTVTGGRLGGP